MHEGLCIILDTSCIFKFRTNYLSCVSECVIVVLSTLCYLFVANMAFGHTQIQGMIHGRDAAYNVISFLE